MKEAPLFRLAATLYADNNYVVRQSTILKKVLECYYLQNSNRSVTIGEAIIGIESAYGLQLSLDELSKIVSTNADCFNYDPSGKPENHRLALAQSRFNALRAKNNTKTLDAFIDEFLSRPEYCPDI